MFTYEVVISAVLLTSPGAEVKGLHPWVSVTYPSLLALAVEAEIIDPRGVPIYVYMRDETYMVERLSNLRDLYQELHDAPMLAECQRFPGYPLIVEMIAANRQFRAELGQRLAIDLVHQGPILEAIEQTEQLYRIWSEAKDVQGEHYYVTVRRQSLRTLRGIIGPEAFYAGTMPPPLPLWAIPRK